VIFRVFGKRGDGSETSVDIECDSEAVARNEAVRFGLVNTTRVEVVAPEAATENEVRTPRAARHRESWPRPVLPRQRGTHWGIGKAFELGFGFGLGLAAASLVLALIVGIFRVLISLAG